MILKKRKKKILIAVAVVVVAAIAVTTFLSSKGGAKAMPVQCVPLNKTEISNTVSTTGIVESTDAVNVYTDLNYAVKTIPVKVGDHVNAGDVLCELDSQDLKDTIAQKQAALRSSDLLSAQKIQSSQKKYNDAKNNLNAGLNTQINAAQEKVDSAKRELENAQQKQSDAEKHIQENLNTSLISAKQAVSSAKITLDYANQKYADVKKHLKDGDYAETDNEAKELYLNPAREAMESAQLAYDTAQKNLNALNTAADEERAQYAKSTESAQAAYNDALKSLKATQIAVGQDLQTSQDEITSNKLAADDTTAKSELTALQTKLGKCRVTAPDSGTITAVYAVKNSPANGLLFVIEDTHALKVKVKIKEYDVASVKTGMPAVIKADAISGKEFQGVLQKISPASIKGNDGKAASGTDAEFEADILVTSKDTGMLIGMNARAEIILQKKENVFTVPVDAVAADAQGKSVIYTTGKADKDGTCKTEAITVTAGIETDSMIEISGSGLKEGMQVISDGKTVTPGMAVQAADAGAAGGGEAAAVNANAGD